MKFTLLILATLVSVNAFAKTKPTHRPSKPKLIEPIVATCDNGDVYTLQKGKVAKNGVQLVPTLSPIEHFVGSGSIYANQKIDSDGTGRYYIFNLMADTTRAGDFVAVWVNILDNSQMEPVETKICHTNLPL